MENPTRQLATKVVEDSRGRVLIVLCTFNEIQTLPQVLHQLQLVAPKYDILVVDDNSPDGTGEWTQQQTSQVRGLHLLSRPHKLGLGSALRDGIRWCLGRDYQFLVNLDADMSHDPSQVPRLIELCDNAVADVAIGSRYVEGGSTEGLSAVRMLISRALNRYATQRLSLPISDCSGSYRCYRVRSLQQLRIDDLTCNGYGFLEEILTALHRQGAKLVELPITYHVRQGGRSKLSVADAWGALGVIHRLRRTQ